MAKQKAWMECEMESCNGKEWYQALYFEQNFVATKICTTEAVISVIRSTDGEEYVRSWCWPCFTQERKISMHQKIKKKKLQWFDIIITFFLAL